MVKELEIVAEGMSLLPAILSMIVLLRWMIKGIN
jgi:hypothetical protein